MDIPRSFVKPVSNSDIIRTSSIRNASQQSLTYNFRYIGSSPMQLNLKSKTGFGSVIQPLKQLYLAHVLDSRNHSQERLVVLDDSSLTIRYWDQRMKSFTRDLYPMSHVTYFDAARFQMLRLKKKVSNHGVFRRFSEADDNFDLVTEGNMVAIEKKHRKLFNALPHPPLVVMVLRRPRGVSFLDTHIFIAESDVVAQSFVHELALRILNCNENVPSDIFQYEHFCDFKSNRNSGGNDAHPGVIAQPQSRHSYFGNVGAGALQLAQVRTPTFNQKEIPQNLDQFNRQDLNNFYEDIEISEIDNSTMQHPLTQFGSQQNLQRKHSNVESSERPSSGRLFKKISSKSSQQRNLKAAKSMHELHKTVNLEAQIGLAATKVGQRFQRELRRRERSLSPSPKDIHQKCHHRSIQELAALSENETVEERKNETHEYNEDKRHSVSQLISNFELTTVHKRSLSNEVNVFSSSQNWPVNIPSGRQQQQKVLKTSESNLKISSTLISGETRILTSTHGNAFTPQRLNNSKSKDFANEQKMRQHTAMVKQTKAAEIEDDLRKLRRLSKKIDLQTALGYLP